MKNVRQIFVETIDSFLEKREKSQSSKVRFFLFVFRAQIRKRENRLCTMFPFSPFSLKFCDEEQNENLCCTESGKATSWWKEFLCSCSPDTLTRQGYAAATEQCFTSIERKYRAVWLVYAWWSSMDEGWAKHTIECLLILSFILTSHFYREEFQCLILTK